MNRYLIWSNEHAMWWRENESGYTQHIDEAGRYDRADAERIVADATVGGQLSTQREDPRNGCKYREFSEVIVAAPETLEATE
jgi:hypothetical protein